MSQASLGQVRPFLHILIQVAVRPSIFFQEEVSERLWSNMGDLKHNPLSLFCDATSDLKETGKRLEDHNEGIDFQVFYHYEIFPSFWLLTFGTCIAPS